MGEARSTWETKLDGDVAIKLLPESMSRDKGRVLRFERQAQLLASLNHPYDAAIHGFDETGGKKFLVLEYVEGETLARRLKRGPLPLN
jgi:serine/threonine protein kinase